MLVHLNVTMTVYRNDGGKLTQEEADAAAHEVVSNTLSHAKTHRRERDLSLMFYRLEVMSDKSKQTN